MPKGSGRGLHFVVLEAVHTGKVRAAASKYLKKNAMLGCCFAVGVGPYGGSNIVPSGCVVLRMMYSNLAYGNRGSAVSSPLPHHF